MRKLTLKKETVADLTTDELGGVVGGTFPSKYDCTVSEELSVCLSSGGAACVRSLRCPVPTNDACFTAQGCG